jgi:predicted Zn-dependent protease
MKYENRQPKEGINVSKHSPVKLLLQLMVATLVMAVMLIFLLQVSGSWLAKKIPFRFEESVMEKVPYDFGGGSDNEQVTAYLNELASRIDEYLPNPDNVRYTVHYNPQDTFNAFATVGGNIVFFKGLLDKMPNENALAMVMAHEMAHVAHRDPVSGLGGGVASMVALSALLGSSGSGPASTFISNTGGLASVQFTRKMENNADDEAITALGKMYGHTQGADTLFRLIAQQRGENTTPDWLERFSSTHPLDADRVANIAEKARQQELPIQGALTPLPAFWNNAL